MTKQGTIYKIENLVNGKVYIGQTISFKSRKSTHLSELRNGKKLNIKLQNAWDKYGEDNFVFKMIGRYDISELDCMEIYFVKVYDSFKNGYNMTTGGNQGTPNHILTSGQKKAMSRISKELWSCKKHKKKMSDAHNTFRPIVLTNTGEIFNSTLEASKKYFLENSNIIRNCDKGALSAGQDNDGNRLIWVWADEYDENIKYSYEHNRGGHNRKKVICVDTGEIFNSSTDAEKHYGIGKTGVSKVCNGKRSYTGLKDGTKLKWKYA